MHSTLTTDKPRLSKKQLAEATGVRPSTIQFYSEIGLLPYFQAGEGLARRYNRDQAAVRLREIQELQELGLSIDAIRTRLASH
jgi:DNA-binding transcriptional MerR regulator